MRMILSCISLNWRPRAHLASNAALWSSLSGESFIDRRNPMLFRSLLSPLAQLAVSFDLLASRWHPPPGLCASSFAPTIAWLCPATNVSARPNPQTYTQCEYYACKIAECGYFRSNQCKVIRTVDANSVVEMSPCPPKYLCSYCLQIPHTQVFGCFDNTLY